MGLSNLVPVGGTCLDVLRMFYGENKLWLYIVPSNPVKELCDPVAALWKYTSFSSLSLFLRKVNQSVLRQHIGIF